MLLRKIGVQNYFIVLLILLTLTAALVIITIILSAVFPGSLGRSPYYYETGPVYEFEPWFFEADDLKVSFSTGGLITTLHEGEHKRSIMLIGEGHYEDGAVKLDSDEAGGLFMVIEHGLFDRIRGSNIFTPLEDQTLISRVEEVAALQKGIPYIWGDIIPLTFHTQDDLIYYYFLAGDGMPIFPPHSNGDIKHFLGPFLIHFLIFLIIILIMTIFSPDHRYSRYWVHLGATPPGMYSLAIIPFIIAVLLTGKILVHINEWPDYYNSLIFLFIIFFLYLSSRYGKIDYLDLGLRRDRIKHGYLLAIITALILITVIGGIPEEWAFEKESALISLLSIYFLIGLPRELIWRGYIQAFLSRQLDPTRGLLIMIFLTAIAHYLYLIITAPWMINYPYTYLEALILVPGTAAILGYLYLRTENILACAFLHTLIFWLPGIIIY